jgi:anti-anti-sigma factor
MALAQVASPDWPVLCVVPAVSVTPGDGHTLVRLEGEHDIASVFALAHALSVAISLDDADLVVDLSNVAFMGSAPMRVLVRCRKLLRGQSRDLTVRSPAPCVQRMLDLCGLGDFVARAPIELVR